eukprot:4493249-Pleurochrysis_carterae.AAC.1
MLACAASAASGSVPKDDQVLVCDGDAGRSVVRVPERAHGGSALVELAGAPRGDGVCVDEPLQKSVCAAAIGLA